MISRYMKIILTILIAFVAIQHAAFLYLEMFLWTRDTGRRIFGNTKEQAENTKVLAKNQGLYNGFLAAGLLWGMFHPTPEIGNQIVLFFLLCVMIAGIYGSITAKRSILYIQALPAFITLIVLFFASA